MFDELARLQDEHLIFLAVMTGLVVTGMTILGAVIAVQFRKLRQKELELGFKDELLLRGYTVDETIRLVTSRKPGWSNGLVTLADWMGVKLEKCGSQLASVTQKATTNGGRLARELWRSTLPSVQRLRRQSGPWFQSAVTRLNQGIHWLTDKTEDFARRLVTPRP